MKKLFTWLLNPPDSGPKATILIRLMAGGVFLWEGVLKFVYTNQGVGRFTKIGIPAPHVMATFIGGLEIVGGILLIAGPGKWSLDALLARRKRESQGAYAGLRIGSVDALPAVLRQSGRNA